MSNTFGQIIAGSLQLSVARVAVLLVSILQSFILAKVLGPEGFGQVSLFNLILLYGGLAGLGFSTVASREIPGHIANKDKNSYEFIKNFSFTVEIGFALLLSISTFMFALFFFSGTIRIGAIVISIILFVQKINQFYQNIANALKKFKIVGNAILTQGILTGPLILILVKWCGIYTKILSILFVQIILFFYFYKRFTLNIAFTFDKRKFFSVLKKGLPFVFLSFIFYFWRLSDRTLIAKMLSFEILGIYSFATTCIRMLLVFSNDFNTVLQPFFYERTAVIEGKDEVFYLIRKSTLFYAYLIPLLFVVLWIGFPYLVKIFMPKFMESVWPFRILLLQFYFTNLSVGVVFLLRSSEVNKQFRLSLSYVVAGIFSYILILSFLQKGLSITWVASGIAISNLVAVIINFWMAHKHYLSNYKKAVRYYGLILIPVIYLGLYLYLIEVYFPDYSINNLIFKALFSILFSIPLIYIFNREVKLFGALYAEFKRKFKNKVSSQRA